MKTTYYEYSDMMVVEEGGKYGLEDKFGNPLLPIEYDGIFALYGNMTGIGFMLVHNNKFGYVEFGDWEQLEDDECGVILGAPNGCALAWLPCIYTRMELQRNGLVLYRKQESHLDVGEFWYDFKSRTLYRDLRWITNLMDYDTFLIDGIDSCMPLLKKAGEDAWVKYPKDSAVDPWREIPIDNVGVRCILCTEEIPSCGEEHDGTVDCYEYFFLLLYKDGWVPTPAKRSLAELYAELPAIIKGINNRKKSKDEKQTYTLLCKYKKKNESWE